MQPGPPLEKRLAQIDGLVSFAPMTGALRCMTAILVGVVAKPTFAESPDSRWPVAHAARPLTLSEGLFRLDFFVGGGLVDRQDVAFQLVAGTGYGVTDDLEVGIRLIDVIVSAAEGTGLEAPVGYGQYRLWSGILEGAAAVDVLIPVEGQFAFGASLPMILSILDVVRLDVRPRVAAAQIPDWTATWSVGADLSIQILDQWRIFGGGQITDTFSGPFDPLLRPSGGTAVTFGSTSEPDGDLELFVLGPAIDLNGPLEVGRNLDTDWFVVIAYRPFIRVPTRSASDLFADPEGFGNIEDIPDP